MFQVIIGDILFKKCIAIIPRKFQKEVSPSRQEFMFHWANKKDNYVYTSATLSIFMEEDMKSYAEMLQKHSKNLPEAAIEKTMNAAA